jgi:hypothetical protein
MKIIEALGELAATVGYLRSQPLARKLDPAQELRRLGLACESLKAGINLDKAPNLLEVEKLAEQCRKLDYKLDGFSRRELRLLSWHNGLLMNALFRQNLLGSVQSGDVRPNLSVLAKIYFGTWGEHEDPRPFEHLLQSVAELQPTYSATLELYKKHSAHIFSNHASSFLANEIFSSAAGVSDVLKQWDVPAKSCLASCVIQDYLNRSLVLIEESRSEDLAAILGTLRLPAIRLEMLRKAVERLILCRQADRNEEFRRTLEMFVIDHPDLGDPRYQSNAPHWTGIGNREEQTFRGWRNKVDLVFFFNSVMNDQADKHGRKAFWLRYVNQAHESFVALCSTDAYRLRTSLWREKIQYRKIIDDQGVSCFVMRFRGNSADIVIAEFSKVGSARIFHHKSFVQKIGDMNRQQFWLKELRNDEGADETFRHMPGWQSRVRNSLARYGIRPI